MMTRRVMLKNMAAAMGAVVMAAAANKNTNSPAPQTNQTQAPAPVSGNKAFVRAV
jgi:hypothetical protein